MIIETTPCSPHGGGDQNAPMKTRPLVRSKFFMLDLATHGWPPPDSQEGAQGVKTWGGITPWRVQGLIVQVSEVGAALSLENLAMEKRVS